MRPAKTSHFRDDETQTLGTWKQPRLWLRLSPLVCVFVSLSPDSQATLRRRGVPFCTGRPARCPQPSHTYSAGHAPTKAAAGSSQGDPGLHGAASARGPGQSPGSRLEGPGQAFLGDWGPPVDPAPRPGPENIPGFERRGHLLWPADCPRENLLLQQPGLRLPPAGSGVDPHSKRGTLSSRSVSWGPWRSIPPSTQLWANTLLRQKTPQDAVCEIKGIQSPRLGSRRRLLPAPVWKRQVFEMLTMTPDPEGPSSAREMLPIRLQTWPAPPTAGGVAPLPQEYSTSALPLKSQAGPSSRVRVSLC